MQKNEESKQEGAEAQNSISFFLLLLSFSLSMFHYGELQHSSPGTLLHSRLGKSVSLSY